MKQQTHVLSSEKPCVLIVEDDQFLGETLTDILRLMDIDTHLARDGLAGEMMYRQYQDRIALIILDWSLPAQDGITTLHQIRQINAEVRVMFLSGHKAEKVEKEIPSADFHFVTIITKPFKMDTFLNEVSRLLA